ncbi:MAG TPA: hypothetical protein VJZ93_00490 [Candidatus Nanoarchaeia archaeon]|nr:hypothetical protein [Candidatus Nanoarchaeia archaeon]
MGENLEIKTGEINFSRVIVEEIERTKLITDETRRNEMKRVIGAYVNLMLYEKNNGVRKLY